jgi:hypothetical protein
MAIIYGLPSNLFRDTFDWFYVDRASIDEFVAKSYRFKDMDQKPQILELEVEVVGILDNSLKDGHFDRVLVSGIFPDRPDKDWAIAIGERYMGLEGQPMPAQKLGEGRHLINLLQDSDSGETEIPILELAKVATYTERKDLEFNAIGHAPYAGRSIDRLELAMVDGSTRVAYVHSVGYSEGYQYDIFASRKAALGDAYDQERQRAKQDWTATECWECGATYTEPGHVEPGQMGCEKCNA